MTEADAARADARRLAEVLRRAPMVIGETATEATHRWETERIEALRLHDQTSSQMVAAIEAEAIRQERARLRELWDRVHPEAMHIRHADECVAPLCVTMRRVLAEP